MVVDAALSWVELPLTYAITAAVLLAGAVWWIVTGERPKGFAARFFPSPPDPAKSVLGQPYDFECEACGELFEERDLAVNHVARYHGDHYPDPEAGVVDRTVGEGPAESTSAG